MQNTISKNKLSFCSRFSPSFILIPNMSYMVKFKGGGRCDYVSFFGNLSMLDAYLYFLTIDLN